ncbi:hypothetical protein WHI96_05600 [Pseudonocardia tropica]|uniref:Uncharacterized protein n=1 Tax=Pseudonocardia tropica TaxID=681289 RepID=A0ABV1JQR7_9PSEU
MSRVVHLVAALVLGTALYAPAGIADPLLDIVRVVVVPALTITGVVLWKQAQLRSLIRRIRS